MIVPRDRAMFLQELIVAEVLARRGDGPLARKRWPRPPRRRVPAGSVQAEGPSAPRPDASEAEPER